MRPDITNVDAPVGFWVTGDGYRELAAQAERNGYADLAKYFKRRGLEADVAKLQQSIALHLEQA